MRVAETHQVTGGRTWLRQTRDTPDTETLGGGLPKGSGRLLMDCWPPQKRRVSSYLWASRREHPQLHLNVPVSLKILSVLLEAFVECAGLHSNFCNPRLDPAFRSLWAPRPWRWVQPQFRLMLRVPGGGRLRHLAPQRVRRPRPCSFCKRFFIPLPSFFSKLLGVGQEPELEAGNFTF